MLRVVVLVSGGGTNLEAILKNVEDGNIPNTEIVGVISNNKNAFALERAKNHGVASFGISPKDYETRQDFHRGLLAKIEELNPDLIVLAGCLIKIPDEMIKAYENRIINIHPSLIPSFSGPGFYGLHVHEAALERGVKITGATVHFVSEIVDGGEIIEQKAVRIEEGDTPEVLQKRVMEEAEWIILSEVISKIAKGEISIGKN